METINDRFKQLRKECHKTQEEWGHILGITRPGVTDIESGRRNVNEKHLIMLSNWKERKVNIEWLRTGEGGPDNMFLHPEENDLVAQAKNILGKNDPLFEALVISYSKLSPKNRDTLLNFFTDFSDTLQKNTKERDVPDTAAAVTSPMPAATPDPRDIDALSAAVREAEEAYIKSRSVSARRKGSSASNYTDGEGGKAINQ
ncbi:MAG: helix-turn-helix transcriptional regulator [Dorea sp.]|jgi:DNA-binding XRE family transcriptional regulator|nr:helix-turn-helix transcriptional regulator [Dorea sp.]